MIQPTRTVRGFRIFEQFLSEADQIGIVDDVREIARTAPMRRYATPYGKRMSVRMTAAGEFGWISDRAGYRYLEEHSEGTPWPSIPESVLRVWENVAECGRRPDSCLINFYGTDARMGMHQDNTEADFRWPVVSISLGDAGLFRIGNLVRGGTTESVWLTSGDVVVMGGEARLRYHGIDRVRFGSSGLLRSGGRLNLTLRVAK